ncbi:MAG: type II secretion system protein [Pseudomonadota bacterium]
MKPITIGTTRGFTLLEVIIALIVAGILGVMLVSFTGTVLQHSGDAANTMVRFYNRIQVMDDIIADYRADITHRQDASLASLAADISSGHYNTSHATVQAQFITYSVSNPPVEQAASGGNLLKVTVTAVPSGDGLTMTTLFTN